MRKTLNVTIKGTSPMLMHRFPLEEIPGINKMQPQEIAEIAAYRDDKGELYIPAMNLWRALINGAAYSKGKGRSNLSKVAAACIDVSPEKLYLNTKTYQIDSRSVVNPSTGGRVVSHRPRLDAWALTFTLGYDAEYLSESDCRKILVDTGTKIGVGDWRPEKKGPMGKFEMEIK